MYVFICVFCMYMCAHSSHTCVRNCACCLMSLLVIPGSFPAESNSTWSQKRGSGLERDGGGPYCNLSILEEQTEESGVQD